RRPPPTWATRATAALCGRSSRARCGRRRHSARLLRAWIEARSALGAARGREAQAALVAEAHGAEQAAGELAAQHVGQVLEVGVLGEPECLAYRGQCR